MRAIALLLAAVSLTAQTADHVTVDSVLDWLPKDTETILVAQKSFQILHADAEPADALDMAHGYVLGLLGAAENERLIRTLQGQSIRFAVVAARKFGFRDDDSLGLVSYEGCAAYAFAKPLDAAIFARTAEEKLPGNALWLSKGSQNESKYEYTYRTTLLKPDLLLICNNQNFLNETLATFDSASPSKVRQALPASLPEWKQVDRSAPVWGLRHFAQQLELDYIHPERGKGDPTATGSTMQVGPASAVLGCWVSKANADPWREFSTSKDLKGRATTRRNALGGWEVAVSASNKEVMFFATAALFGSLGFVANM
jgi:hypothetical protein